MEKCCCCSKDLSQGEEKKRRHLLSSTGHAELLASLASEVDSEIDVETFESGYICRQCERKVKSYKDRRDEIISIMTKAVPILPKRSAAVGAQPVISSTSPAVTTSVHYRSRTRSYVLTPARRRICKPLVRHSFNSFAIESVKRNKSTRDAIVKVLGQILHNEIASLCSDDFDSIMKKKEVNYLKNFENITAVILKEMESKSPTLLSLLQSCLKSKRPRPNTKILPVVIVSLLCKHRRPRVCLLQKVLSIILYVGHSSKLVFERLQKAGICVSHSSTVNLVSQLGEGYDLAVRQWKQETEGRISAMKDILRQLGGTATKCLIAPPSCLYADVSSNIVDPQVTLTVHEVPDFDVLTSSVNLGSSLCSAETIQQSQPPHLSQPLLLDINVHKIVAGFKLVFDNFDKTIKPRHMTQDRQSVSMHNVHAYGVKDRLNYSDLDSARDPAEEMNLYSILPNSDDYTKLKERFKVHISRIIVEYLQYFHDDFRDLVMEHIPHRFSREMSQKSEVIPLGALPKNEVRYEDVIEILEAYKQYVPFQKVVLEEPPPDSDEATDVSYAPLLLGGDYLSVARVRGAQLIRGNSELEKDRLDAFVPCAEDWHCKLALLEVYWKRLFLTKSGMEPGTLYQLRNLINRRNVTKKPKKNVNAAEDFVEVVTIAHILSAVMSRLKMSSLDGIPSPDMVPENMWMEDDSVRKQLLADIATFIVDTHVDLATTFKDPNTKDSPTTCHTYACEALTLGLFIIDFKDAVREGDGDWDISLWKYMFLFFMASNRKNYAIEAFTLLSQYYLLLPPNIAEQLKWSRFVNIHGLPGTNVSCDLHMEHLNRLLKAAVEGLGANKSEKAICRAAKALKVVSEVTESYDREAKVVETSSKHADVSFRSDIETIVKQLLECDTFNKSSKSTHASFGNLKRNLISTLEEKKVKDWMTEHFTKILQPQTPNLTEYEQDSEDSADEICN